MENLPFALKPHSYLFFAVIGDKFAVVKNICKQNTQNKMKQPLST